MELDPQHLQLIFNVIAITGVTSLAAICYLLKRDKQELLNRLNPQCEPDQHDQKHLAPPSSAASAPEQGAILRKEPDALPVRDTSIRQYVTAHAQGWIAPSPSQWNRRLGSNHC
jgi:hypothetical protein